MATPHAQGYAAAGVDTDRGAAFLKNLLHWVRRTEENRQGGKAMEKLQNVKCDDDEILCLMDFGSSLNGISVAKEIPEYPHIASSRGFQTWRSAKCANGTGLKH